MKNIGAHKATCTQYSVVEWQFPGWVFSHWGWTMVEVAHQDGRFHVGHDSKESCDLIVLLLVVVGVEES